jgi:deoxyribodipyrimidine photo-lyase
MTIQVLWFKRDLRLHDHAALLAAAKLGPILPLFVVEPEYWRQPDTSARQWEFQRGCLSELGAEISTQDGKLLVRTGDVVEILEELRRTHGPIQLWSHIETGNSWTYTRDRKVQRWARAHNIIWQELPQFAVHRARTYNRDKWASAWDRMMSEPVLTVPQGIEWVDAGRCDDLPSAMSLELHADGLSNMQTPGRMAGLNHLHRFLFESGENYTFEMSSPLTAEHACSRLSPYIAYGALSMREIAQSAWQRAHQLGDLSTAARGKWPSALRSFIARLHWHCHFVQKLESEPQIEFLPMAKIYQGLRPAGADDVKFSAWKTGQTGYPFVDAAMRYLIANGWINFRMRAMLMSFASYDLWLPWQDTGKHLARLFVDYEPGIHWPQCQMQSGETGINTVRIYAPVKQGHDQDPAGDFVRRWVPELANVPGALVHEPWRLSDEMRQEVCPNYPERIVDHRTAAAYAKTQISALRRTDSARHEAAAVFQKHGSRKRTAQRSRKVVKPKRQLSLDF